MFKESFLNSSLALGRVLREVQEKKVTVVLQQLPAVADSDGRMEVCYVFDS